MFSPATQNSRAGSAPPRRRKVSGQKRTLPRSGSVRAGSVSHKSVVSENASVEEVGDSEMDVDGLLSVQNEQNKRTGIIFAQSDEMSVTLHAHLPTEVLRVLKSADYVSTSFTGNIDTKNHFCLVASIETCFVWRYAQLLPGPPTCFIFPCPTRYSEPQAPFAALVSYNISREPGLIILTPYGEIRFWDSIGLGLTGGEATHDAILDLSSDEAVTDLIYAEPQTFVATSTSGRLFLLSVTSTDGKFRVTSHRFSLSKPTGSYFQIGSWLGGSDNKPQYKPGRVTAAAVTDVDEEGFKVWTCVGSQVVIWSVLHKGWEELQDADDVQDTLFDALIQFYPDITAIEEMDLELLDVAFNAQKEPILLISFSAGLDEESNIDTRPRRVYAVLRMTRELEVALVRTLPYETISADTANIQPRLNVMDGGKIYSVQFGDALAFVANETEYSNLLTLKSIQDRTFGCSAVENTSELLFMNSAVLMRVEMDVDKINGFNESTWRGTSIKSIMTQAILFGANPKNPLLFTFPPDIDEESLITGAEQLSQAALSSDTEIVRVNPDLTRQITERRERLRFLIEFINENGALGKMSQTSRQRLAMDAERLYVAEQLWLLYSERVNVGHDEHLFQEVIASYMEKSEEQRDEDVLRAFFKYKTRDIASILPYLKLFVHNSAYHGTDSETLTRAVDYLLCIMQMAWHYRDTNAGVHGLIGSMVDAWTSSSPVADIVLDFFNFVDRKLAEAPTGSEDTSISSLLDQLPKLASVVFRCFQERQDWLDSPAAADMMGIEGDRREFHERFQQLRPVILHTLLKYDKEPSAFLLAEVYRDFPSLADLCHSTPPIFPLQSNKHAGRLREYVERYQDEFTDNLCQWYIEHAELRCLYAQGEIYGDFVDAFFSRHPHPSMSWVHEVGKGRWGEVSSTLLAQSDHTADLETRHALLSIGKLAQIAESEKTSVSAEQVLDAFHGGLDYISVHERIIEDLRSCLAGSKSRQSLENQAELVLKAVAPSLRPTTYPGFYSEFKVKVKELLQSLALGVEDLVDILTLREDKLEFGTALELVKNVKNIPDARKVSAFRTVWRRIYIHDDWPNISRTTNKTDAQLDSTYRRTALYATVKDALLRAEDEQHISASKIDLSQIVYPLEESANLPTTEELEGRWPGHSEDQIEELEADYRKEQEKLQAMGMEAIIDRVKELALEELRIDVSNIEIDM